MTGPRGMGRPCGFRSAGCCEVGVGVVVVGLSWWAGVGRDAAVVMVCEGLVVLDMVVEGVSGGLDIGC